MLGDLERELSVPFNVLLITDSPDDTTNQEASNAAAALGWPKQQLHWVMNQGQGPAGALLTGLENAHGTYAAIVMADGCDDIATLATMVQLARTRQVDLVCATRNKKLDGMQGQRLNAPWLKGQLSKLVGLSLHWAGMPISDATNSFKLFRTDRIHELTLASTQGFVLGLEASVKAWEADWPMSEVATVWRERTHGTSRFRLLKWAPTYMRWYFRALGVAVRNAVP